MSEIETDVFTVADLVAFKKRAVAVRKKHDLSVAAFRSWAGEVLGRTVPKVDFTKSEWQQMLVAMESKEGPPEQPNIFRFNSQSWRNAATLSRDFVPPEDAFIDLVVDPSWTVADWSDKTGMAVGYKTCREDGGYELTLLHAFSDRLKWDPLIEKIVSTALQFHVARIRIERNHIGPTDLLADSVRAKLKEKLKEGISVDIFNPDRAPRAKGRRIQQLETVVLAANPPRIRFCYFAPFVPSLFEEIDTFLFEKEKKRDRSREDSMLDAISILAFPC